MRGDMGGVVAYIFLFIHLLLSYVSRIRFSIRFTLYRSEYTSNFLLFIIVSSNFSHRQLFEENIFGRAEAIFKYQMETLLIQLLSGFCFTYARFERVTAPLNTLIAARRDFVFETMLMQHMKLNSRHTNNTHIEITQNDSIY